MLLIIVIVLIVLCVSTGPQWGFHDMGYVPSGLFGIILLIIVVLWILRIV